MVVGKDAAQKIEEMLRVDHAGEYGAVRIYEGQLAFTKDPKTRALLTHMLDQEKQHLSSFNRLMVEHAVPATLWMPLWHVGGYAIGAITALLGEKSAHACTIAVENVIEGHYQEQIDELDMLSHPKAKEFQAIFQRFKDEETEHKHTAEEEGGEAAPFFPMLNAVIGSISKAAIWLSKRG